MVGSHSERSSILTFETPAQFNSRSFSLLTTDNGFTIYNVFTMFVMRGSTMQHRSIGERIRGLRKEHGLTQAELGERAGLHQVQIAQLEADRYRSPRLETLRAVAKALGVSLTDLLE